MDPAAAARRRDGAATAASIRQAARTLFSAGGFGGTSVRDIAQAAEVDPALVIRYFGSKERLFIEALTVERSLSASLAGPVSGLAEALLRALLTDTAQTAYTMLMRAADRPDVRAHLLRVNEQNLARPVEQRLTGPGAALRASCIAAQANGLMHALWILEDPVLTALPLETVITTYAVPMQLLVEPPDAAPPSGPAASGAD